VSATAAPAARAGTERTVGGELLRFAVVGAIGFVVDAGILTWLVSLLAWNVYAARAVSFGVAVVVTWLVNRRWTFAHRGPGVPAPAGAGAEYARYLTVQVTGALANLGVFAAALAVWPRLIAYPVVPLAIGAVAGLVVNFVGARQWVFAHRPDAEKP
jgi:putative flippase GtrA